MDKKIICFLTAAVLSLGGAMTVSGEEHQGSKNWKVEFDGNKMDSNFSSSELAEEIYSIQPGDSMELQVVLKNSGEITTDWYMTNEVLATLEDSQDTAGGGAYTYRLSYVGKDGAEDVLYDSEAVGGEGDKGSAGEGLHQADNSLKDFFYLDTLENGRQGAVKLRVKLDGESQGNDYQDTLARLQMNFAVEKAESQVVTVTPTPIQNTIRRTLRQDSPGIIAAAVQTNDPTQILPYCLAALGAGILFLILGAAALRRRRDAEGKGGDQK